MEISSLKGIFWTFYKIPEDVHKVMHGTGGVVWVNFMMQPSGNCVLSRDGRMCSATLLMDAAPRSHAPPSGAHG
jgi:hypothetical protein